MKVHNDWLKILATKVIFLLILFLPIYSYAGDKIYGNIDLEGYSSYGNGIKYYDELEEISQAIKNRDDAEIELRRQEMQGIIDAIDTERVQQYMRDLQEIRFRQELIRAIEGINFYYLEDRR